MAERDYWFARRFPVGHPRRAVAPINAKGWAVAAAFLAGMLASGVAFALLASSGALILGAIVMALGAFASGGFFIWMALAHGDQSRTVADHRAARAGPPTQAPTGPNA